MPKIWKPFLCSAPSNEFLLFSSLSFSFELSCHTSISLCLSLRRSTTLPYLPYALHQTEHAWLGLWFLIIVTLRLVWLALFASSSHTHCISKFSQAKKKILFIFQMFVFVKSLFFFRKCLNSSNNKLKQQFLLFLHRQKWQKPMVHTKTEITNDIIHVSLRGKIHDTKSLFSSLDNPIF